MKEDFASETGAEAEVGQVQRIAYTPERAALVVGRSRTRIFKAIKNKELRARKDGRATLIEASELRRWVHSLPMVAA
jgi:excisionase family DNA binding protein